MPMDGNLDGATQKGSASAIVFIDTEVSEKTHRIQDIGGVREDGVRFHSSRIAAFVHFLKDALRPGDTIRDRLFLCGHNLLAHDLVYLMQETGGADLLNRGEDMRLLREAIPVDTLPMSPLLFPKRPYHALLKDDKLQTDELNNPLNDAIKARDLFYDEVAVFDGLPMGIRTLYLGLLRNQPAFMGFFQYLTTSVDKSGDVADLEALIRSVFPEEICARAPLLDFINQYPVELAYCLALIRVDDETSIMPPWVLRNYPQTDRLMRQLRGTPCLEGCPYCHARLDPHRGLKRFFGHDTFRLFDGIPLQEQAVNAALFGRSLLAVFPTGGGKSITFQVPALVAGQAEKGLTVVISPLQSLMKDQVDNLERQDITQAVTINGLLDPIERANALHRVENGDATLLYISPESLRSRTMERVLQNRKIIRFVIDEAHCFSSWGQDFRVDYQYIAPFIKSLCEKKQLSSAIPVSCFTATAKQNVINDILSYFRENLGLDLELYTASSSRKNLHYQVLEQEEAGKMDALRTLLMTRDCPTIIYVSRTKKAEELAQHLCADGFAARPYHGQMDKQVKSENQDAFMRGDIRIIVATSAFGMGVDKKDVGMVIHYNISDSLENYVQEAGRAGRDEALEAECYVLFNDEDLNKHFLLLNQTRLGMSDIQNVWRAIKESTRLRSHMSESALEIARKAGWDTDVKELETRVKTAILALEQAGYVKRGQNMPHVFADSILARNVAEASERIRTSPLFSERDQQDAIRIIINLIGSRSRQVGGPNVGESRVDYLADKLGLERERVVHAIQRLREAGILADGRDLTAFLDEAGSMNRVGQLLNQFREIETHLLRTMPDEPVVIHVKELNEQAEAAGLKRVTPERLRTVLNFWEVHGDIRRAVNKNSPHSMKLAFEKPRALFSQQVAARGELSAFILSKVGEKADVSTRIAQFSVLELMNAWNGQLLLGLEAVTSREVEDALLYLSRIGALRLEGGFLVLYNSLSLERLEMDNRVRYKVEDYKTLKTYYEQKMRMIHIVGEYARRMMTDYQSALQFVEDYFALDHSSFLRKYFKGDKGEEIGRNMTPEKFRRIFGELSASQLAIVNDKESRMIVVAAGPGSGKTRTLVHKLASLLLMEDIRHEQLLMVTFSRAAATEFKRRLQELIGNAAHFVEIKTFHSYCFDLLGRVGSLDKSAEVVAEAVRLIRSGEAEASRITKAVLVIDEAQDMDAHEAALIEALIARNEDMRVIAVGDDDQNIFDFRGSDSKHMQTLLNQPGAKLYELVQNYRSRRNLVAFTNIFGTRLQSRMKTTPIMPVRQVTGSIRVFQYASRHLVTPLVERLSREGIRGSTCVLTKSNEEALLVTGMLQQQGISARLIQSTETVELTNLAEIRLFVASLQLKQGVYVIAEEAWEMAKRSLLKRFGGSIHLPMVLRLLRAFEEVNQKYKYVSDFMTFLRESKEEDFLDVEQGTLVVATMHKSKGREFDHVVLLLDRIRLDASATRLLYVAMTRARQSLDIHCNGDYLGRKDEVPYRFVEGLSYEREERQFREPDRLILQLFYPDVFLSYFRETRTIVESLTSGDTLRVDDKGCKTVEGRRVLLFSQRFKALVAERLAQGYTLYSARAKYLLFWMDKEPEGEQEMTQKPPREEVLVVFPEVEFRRMGTVE